MENEKKNMPDRLCVRLNYKFLRYGTVYQIEGKDKLFFNYVLSRSRKTDKQNADGSFIYENHNLYLEKIEDIAYIKSLLYKLKTKKTDREIKEGMREEKRSHYYYAQLIKGANDKFNSYSLAKTYKDKKSNNEEKKTDPKKCVFPLVELPIVLNLFEEINLKTTRFYKQEWADKSKFYGTDTQNDLPPQDEGFVDELIDDDIPF